MINFGMQTLIKLGSVRDANAYLDVVNIDRYDMIIGTLFMRKHGFVLDFDKDVLSHKGEIIPTLSAGQEDLMILKKRKVRSKILTALGGSTSKSNL